MRGLPINFLLFRNEFNKLNNTEARMLDSVYHMTLKLIKKIAFWRENVNILPYFMQRYNGRHNVSRKSVNDGWLFFLSILKLFHNIPF